jgi:DNA (cytosine-5)-methyltransferase 1
MNFVDLFCGMGGASCGAVAAGMRVALAVDACPRALETHRQNHPDATHICATLPVKHLPLPPAPRHIHASPPCQKLSRANLNADDSEKERSVALVQWAVRFARRHGTTWSLEQVDSARVRACLDEEGIEYAVFDLSLFGLPQTRRRLLAGSSAIVALLRAYSSPRRGVRDVIAACRGTHVRNRHAKHPVMRGGVRTYVACAGEQSARSIVEPAYCVTGTSAIKWWSPGDARCVVLSARELALLQSFPHDYCLHRIRKYATIQVGNAFPPLVAELVCRAAATGR